MITPTAGRDLALIVVINRTDMPETDIGLFGYAATVKAVP